MSYAELAEFESRIAALKAKKRNAQRSEVRQKIAQMAKQYGFDIRELFGERVKERNRIATKYRDPENPQNTWTGRGRMPRWMAAATKGSKAKREEFLIK